MNIPASPFVGGRPLRAEEPIFGREEVFAVIHSQLAKLGSVNVVGERRMGKTSVLSHLLGNPQHQPPLGQPPLIVVRVDLQNDITEAAQFYGLALREILQGLPTVQPWKEAALLLRRLREEPRASSGEFNQFLSALKVRGLARPVLLVDEFEQLLDPKLAAGFPFPFFFDGLRSQITADRLALVVASRLTLAQHFQQHPAGMTSNFPSYLPPVFLRELDMAAADSLLLQNDLLNVNEIHQAKQWAGLHPCRLQCAGQAWFEAKRHQHDTAWAKRRYHELKDQACLVRVADSSNGKALKPFIVGLQSLPRWAMGLLARLGGWVKWVGVKGGDISNIVLGLIVIILVVAVAVGLYTGKLSIVQILEMLNWAKDNKP